jgi:hypothetical protein
VRDAEKVADFLLGRLNKSNLIVKLKALQLIAVRPHLMLSCMHFFWLRVAVAGNESEHDCFRLLMH